MLPTAEGLRRAATVSFGSVLVVACVYSGLYAYNSGTSPLETLGITVHVQTPSANSYVDSVFPRYKSFDPSGHFLRLLEKSVHHDHTDAEGAAPETHSARNEDARTQIKYIPARDNPEVSEDMKRMLQKWQKIVRELNSVQDMLACASKCPDQDEKEQTQSQTRKLKAETDSQGGQDASSIPVSGAEDNGARIVSTDCLVACGVPAEMLNFSQAAHDLGKVRTELQASAAQDAAERDQTSERGGSRSAEERSTAKMKGKARLQELFETEGLSAVAAEDAATSQAERRRVRSMLEDWTATFARSLVPQAHAVDAGVGGQDGIPFATWNPGSVRHTPGRPKAIREVVNDHQPDVTDPKHPHEFQGYL